MTCQLPGDSFTFSVFSLLKDVTVVVWATQPLLVNASTSQRQPELDRLSLLSFCGFGSFSPSATCECGCLVSPFGTRLWSLSQAP